MSTQIGIVIYGFPITTVDNFMRHIDNIGVNIPRERREELKREWKDDGCCSDNSPFGFTTLYSSSGQERLGYLGVRLAPKFNTWDPILLSDLQKYKPTKKQIEDVDQMVKNLPSELRPIVAKHGPNIWLVWESS